MIDQAPGKTAVIDTGHPCPPPVHWKFLSTRVSSVTMADVPTYASPGGWHAARGALGYLLMFNNVTGESKRLPLTGKYFFLNVVSVVAKSKPTTGKDLVAALRASGVIGRWKDRTDIGDSTEFARRLRRRAEERSWD